MDGGSQTTPGGADMAAAIDVPDNGGPGEAAPGGEAPQQQPWQQRWAEDPIDDDVVRTETVADWYRERPLMCCCSFCGGIVSWVLASAFVLLFPLLIAVRVSVPGKTFSWAVVWIVPWLVHMVCMCIPRRRADGTVSPKRMLLALARHSCLVLAELFSVLKLASDAGLPAGQSNRVLGILIFVFVSGWYFLRIIGGADVRSRVGLLRRYRTVHNLVHALWAAGRASIVFLTMACVIIKVDWLAHYWSWTAALMPLLVGLGGALVVTMARGRRLLSDFMLPSFWERVGGSRTVQTPIMNSLLGAVHDALSPAATWSFLLTIQVSLFAFLLTTVFVIQALNDPKGVSLFAAFVPLWVGVPLVFVMAIFCFWHVSEDSVTLGDVMAEAVAAAGETEVVVVDTPEAGLTEDEIEALFPYETYGGKRASASTSEPDDCVICLDGILEHDTVRNLPCGHLFHRACIDPWFSKSTFCPLCKRDFRPSTDGSSAETATAVARSRASLGDVETGLVGGGSSGGEIVLTGPPSSSHSQASLEDAPRRGSGSSSGCGESVAAVPALIAV